MRGTNAIRDRRRLIVTASALAATLLDPRDAWPEGDDAPTADGRAETIVQATTEERLRELSSALGTTANAHGPDAVSLQVGLLTGTIRAGAIGPTEVAVVGPSPAAGAEYLRFRVLTGLIFDSATATDESSIDVMWSGIAAPAFEGMETIATEPPGIEILFEYGLQAYAEQADGRPDPTAGVRSRTIALRIPASVAQDYAAGALTIEQLRARAFSSSAD